MRISQMTRRAVAVLLLTLGVMFGSATTATAATPIKDLPVKTAANALSFGTMSSFLAERKKSPATRDGRFDWTTDGCSSPNGLNLTQWDKTFANPCLRHDFGYRNWGHDGVVQTLTETQRKKIDDKFLSDMRTVCNAKPVLQQSQCRFWANTYYNTVRVGGRPAYYTD